MRWKVKEAEVEEVRELAYTVPCRVVGGMVWDGTVWSGGRRAYVYEL